MFVIARSSTVDQLKFHVCSTHKELLGKITRVLQQKGFVSVWEKTGEMSFYLDASKGVYEALAQMQRVNEQMQRFQLFQEEKDNAELNRLIDCCLTRHGIGNSLRGRKFLHETLFLLYYDPQGVECLGKGVLQQVAQMNGTEVRTVERAIRYSRQLCTGRKLSNKKFIENLQTEVQLEMRRWRRASEAERRRMDREAEEEGRRLSQELVASVNRRKRKLVLKAQGFSFKGGERFVGQGQSRPRRGLAQRQYIAKLRRKGRARQERWRARELELDYPCLLKEKNEREGRSRQAKTELQVAEHPPWYLVHGMWNPTESRSRKALPSQIDYSYLGAVGEAKVVSDRGLQYGEGLEGAENRLKRELSYPVIGCEASAKTAPCLTGEGYVLDIGGRIETRDRLSI